MDTEGGVGVGGVGAGVLSFDEPPPPQADKMSPAMNKLMSILVFFSM